MCLTTTKRRKMIEVTDEDKVPAQHQKMIEVTEEDNVPDQHQKTKDDRGYRRG